MKKLASIVNHLDLPEDIACGGIHVEIFAESVIVDCCKNVAEYSEGVIKLNTKFKRVNIYGDRMIIRSFCNGQVTVDGTIISVEFE